MSCSIFPGRLVHELHWDCEWIKDCKWIEDCSVIGFVCLFKRSEAMVNVVRSWPCVGCHGLAMVCWCY